MGDGKKKMLESSRHRYRNEYKRRMPKLYTVKQVAKMKGVHPITIYHWLARGILPDRRLPGTKRHEWPLEDFMPEMKPVERNGK